MGERIRSFFHLNYGEVGDTELRPDVNTLDGGQTTDIWEYGEYGGFPERNEQPTQPTQELEGEQ